MLRRQACIFLATATIGAVDALDARPTEAQLQDSADHGEEFFVGGKQYHLRGRATAQKS
jgi:hypothetical protein